jgi:hypothetical protein
MSFDVDTKMLVDGKVTSLDQLSEKTVQKLARRAPDEIFEDLVEAAQNIKNTAQDLMRNSPPRFSFLNKQRAKKKSNRHIPSIPGNPPRPDTGGLRRSIGIDVNESQIEVEVGSSDTVKYGKWLEDGTKNKDGTVRMEPRPWLQPSIEIEAPYLERSVLETITEVARNLTK